jgi:hypothetical protein
VALQHYSDSLDLLEYHVADIISIDKKLARAKSKKDALIRKQKIQSVRKTLQCTQCAFKCERCGIHIDPASHYPEDQRHSTIPYRFCESCSEEYNAYIQHLKGDGDPDAYWHNEAWLDLWRCWINYQSALDGYLKSKEFLQLMQELKQSEPDEDE